MEHHSNRWTAAWRFWGGGFWMAAALLLATGAQARDPLKSATDVLMPRGELIHAQAQTCQVECGQALALCERRRERGTHCPREFQSCKERCSGAKAENPATGRERRKLLCVHRCETSAGLCEESNPKNRGPCRAGAETCRERCE